MDAGLTAARGPQAGFSLFELMVSIAVLAVLAVGAGLATGRGAPDTERDADRFRRAVEQTWSLAILGRETRGLSVTPRQLHLMRADAGRWTAVTRQDWAGRAGLAAVGPPGPPGGPDILFHPDGRHTGFNVVFSGRGPAWRCASDGWSEVRCAAE